jgi:hypothetical protein
MSKARTTLDREREKRSAARKIPTKNEHVAPHDDRLNVLGWPKLDPAAFYGLAGSLVKTIDPHTEADPIAILFQVLVGFGSIIGRNAYFPHEADQHFGNEFLVLVGDTASGRKGTSWGHVHRLLNAVDPDWAENRIMGGLSSGEGLLHEVRDPARDDSGVTDKRLLVNEPEFAGVLKQFERKGNTLSVVLRQGWEGRPLRTLTKATPAKCNAPHISVIGHITPDELRRYLTATDAANGVANRHLFVCVKRSKMLPHGGNLDPAALEPFQQEMKMAAEFARHAGPVYRDDDARDLWETVYPRLSTGRPGLAGAVTARALAHVTRLSLQYAMLERSPFITSDHLRAALACWDYAAASVLFIFGDSLGDSVADEIRERLKECHKGITRTEIRDHFGRHKSAEAIDRALILLEQLGYAERQSVTTSGRPAECWFVSTRA